MYLLWYYFYFVVLLLSHVLLFVTSWTVTCQAFLSLTISWSLLKLTLIQSMVPSNHLILCCSHLLLTSIFPSIRFFFFFFPLSWLFTSSSQSIGASALSTSLSSEYSGLIFFRIHWFDLLAAQGTLKILLQNHSLKHQSFGAQPSLIFIHDYWKSHIFDYTDLYQESCVSAF